MDDTLKRERKKEHFDKYEAFAQKIGFDILAAMVPATRGSIVKALKTDEHLNNIPLNSWDGAHWAVKDYAKKAGIIGGWPLSYTVCVLKHVARHHTDLVAEKRGAKYRYRYGRFVR